MRKEDIASEYKQHMNCCQAVLCAFKDETGLELDLLRKLGSAFGSGMATMDGTCGALVGAEMVLGLVGQQPVRTGARKLFTEFEQQCGSSVCGTIKGIDNGQVLCSCDQCV